MAFFIYDVPGRPHTGISSLRLEIIRKIQQYNKSFKPANADTCIKPLYFETMIVPSNVRVQGRVHGIVRTNAMSFFVNPNNFEFCAVFWCVGTSICVFFSSVLQAIGLPFNMIFG